MVGAMRYKKHLTRWIQEAEAVLRSHKFPTSWDKLKDVQGENNLIQNAILVISNKHYMQQELESGHCEKALNRFFNISLAYEEMNYHRNVIELEDKPIINAEIYDHMSKGIRYKKRVKKGGTKAGESRRKEVEPQHQQIVKTAKKFLAEDKKRWGLAGKIQKVHPDYTTRQINNILKEKNI